MSNPFNPRKIDGAKRGGKKNRPNWVRSIKRDVQGLLDTGSTSGVVANGKRNFSPAMNPHYDGEETVEDTIVPRRSVTRQQHLQNFPQALEFEDMSVKRSQLITKGPMKGQMVSTVEPVSRVVWKSDKTLLTGGKADQFGHMNRKTGLLEDRIRRVTSRSKRIEYKTESIVDTDEVIENPTDDKL